MATLEEINAIAEKYGQPTISGGGYSSSVPVKSRRERLGLESDEGFLKSTASDFRNRVASAQESQGMDQSFGSKALQTIGDGAGFVQDVAANAVSSVLKRVPKFIKDEAREQARNIKEDVSTYTPKFIKEAVSEYGSFVADNYRKWAEENPEDDRNLKSVIDIAAVLPAPKLAKIGSEASANIVKNTAIKAEEGIESMLKSPKETLFGTDTVVNSVDDVMKEADKAANPAKIRTMAESATAKPSIMERWAGISPDIKNRIAGKHDKLKEYFDVAHSRNNFDTLPTPLEYGAKSVDDAVTRMEQMISDTGSDIGSFRRKIGTYKANIDDIGRIEKSFDEQLSKLNLEVRNGEIRQKPGTVTRTNSEKELSVLNDLYADFQTVKQSPDLERLIDLRNLFDGKINFSKTSRDVSGSLDPLSRTVRKSIAEVAEEIVGKSEASNLDKYHRFMDAYSELKSFTDRKAGPEFLLKQVLSDKGGRAREVIQTIKEITGIDLMDDATMATIATDLIGNSRQKGLFRQEIAKAGLDAEAALGGDPSGAIMLMLDFAKNRLINEEKQFLKAAKKKPSI